MIQQSEHDKKIALINKDYELERNKADITKADNCQIYVKENHANDKLRLQNQ